MEKRFGIFILFGLLIGAAFGTFFGAAAENPLFSVGIGALVGLFLGWFIAAIVLETQKAKGNSGSKAKSGKPGISQ